jgi:hypothetical protein
MAGRDGTPPFYIPTGLLGPYINPLIEQLDAELETDPVGNRRAAKGGGVTAVGTRAAGILGDVQPEAFFRRLWSIRTCESTRTHTELADAILMALGVMIEDTDLPTFPGTLSGAKEMVEVWGDGTEEPGFARQLLHFCTGFSKALIYDLEDLAPATEEREPELVAA